ncbi:MAG: putative porin, partial [Gammaproteobacteria bacterium]|nr:putative porin [Gammaproteobacteria bacterium]
MAMKRAVYALSLGMVIGSAVNAPAAVAAVTDEQVQRLLERIEAQEKRIAELEKSSARAPAAAPAPAAAAGADTKALSEQVGANTTRLEKMSWADRIRIEGDFRYRYQNDDVGSPVDDSRNRNRIRARPALIATVSPELSVGFGLATGSDDPVSSNQTLGNAGSSKQINLDLAYFDWTGLTDTSIRGGKFKNSLETAGGSQLQWDSDWRPEGGEITWSNGTFFAQGLGTYLESDSDKGNSEFAYLLQAGARGEIGAVALTGGVGYTSIDAEGKACYYNQSSFVPTADQLCQGNQAAGVPGSLVYANDFEVYDVFAQAGIKVADLPVTVFAEYINNSAADDYEQGYMVGAQLGSAKARGTWQVSYYYEDLESNATLGLLTNSDFGGGGTNGAGSVFSGT